MPSQKTGNPLTGKKRKKIAKLLFQTVICEILIHIKIGEWSSLTLVGVAVDPSSPCPLICSVGSDGPAQNPRDSRQRKHPYWSWGDSVDVS